jgi:hypothetical protein
MKRDQTFAGLSELYRGDSMNNLASITGVSSEEEGGDDLSTETVDICPKPHFENDVKSQAMKQRMKQAASRMKQAATHQKAQADLALRSDVTAVDAAGYTAEMRRCVAQTIASGSAAVGGRELEALFGDPLQLVPDAGSPLSRLLPSPTPSVSVPRFDAISIINCMPLCLGVLV